MAHELLSCLAKRVCAREESSCVMKSHEEEIAELKEKLTIMKSTLPRSKDLREEAAALEFERETTDGRIAQHAMKVQSLKEKLTAIRSCYRELAKKSIRAYRESHQF